VLTFATPVCLYKRTTRGQKEVILMPAKKKAAKKSAKKAKKH